MFLRTCLDHPVLLHDDDVIRDGTHDVVRDEQVGKRPNIPFAVQALSTRQAIEEVTNSQVDLAIVDTASGGEYLAAQELCRAYLGCVLPKELGSPRVGTPHHLSDRPAAFG